MKSYDNTVTSDTIVCPYCGKVWAPSYGNDTYIGNELVEWFREKIQMFKCDNCHKRFRLYSTMSWKYETRTIDGEMSILEYNQISSTN